MSYSTKSYDANAVNIIVDGQPLDGYAPDEFVTVKFGGNAIKKIVGSEGEVTRVGSRDVSGEIVVVLMQSSDSNRLLQDLADKDRVDGSGTFVLSVDCASEGVSHNGATAWVAAYPDWKYAAKAGTRAWIIHTDSLVQLPLDDLSGIRGLLQAGAKALGISIPFL